MADHRPNIGIISPYAYGAMTGGHVGHIGGVERQTSLMAKWLAARGWRVSMITWREGGPTEEMIDGVRLITLCRRDAGVPGLRFFWPRWTSLNAAMRRADANVYYQNCGEYVTGQVALWCRRHGRKFVYSVASDRDCERSLPEMHALRERALYRFGLRRADRVIAQTKRQQQMLAEGFGVKAVVIPMPCAAPKDREHGDCESLEAASTRVAWVGRILELKRLEWLLDIAERMPDIGFDVAGPWGEDSEYKRTLRSRASRLPNVRLLGAVERHRVSSIYQNASMLCCTSTCEGFPNTFLEAWSHGRPIVTTFDPDDLVARRGLGAVAHDVEGLAASIRELLTCPERWRRASENARRYYLENHTVETVMPQFERVFLNAIGRAGGEPE